MDGALANQKIRYGYAKAAQKLGIPYQLYRTNTPFTPIQSPNLIGSLPATFSQDWTWMKANRPGNAIWFSCIDGQESSEPLSAKEMDYLVADKTFFVLSKEFQLPIQVVECNATVTIRRPSQSTDPGGQGYAGYQPGTSDVIMENMPVSCLMSRRGQMAITKLPTDTFQPEFIFLLPNIGPTDIKTGDIATDQSNQNFIFSVTEDTEFGWRCIGQQAVN